MNIERDGQAVNTVNELFSATVAKLEMVRGEEQKITDRIQRLEEERRPFTQAVNRLHQMREALQKIRLTYDGKSPERRGCVYLFKYGPTYKIGKTIHYFRRWNQINNSMPDGRGLQAVAALDTCNMDALERYWHVRFADKREHGEWFTLTDEEVREFRSYSDDGSNWFRDHRVFFAENW